MNQVVKQSNGALAENVLIMGNLSQLTEEQRTNYYMKVCESVGLNPLTRPFEYIVLNSKLVLYARRDATDQLRKIHNVSVDELIETEKDGVFIVTAKVRDKDGRTDIAKGAVNISGMKGDALANALMKAETKAKRRATLSICGLGMLDETELETIPSEAMQPKAQSVFKNASLRNTFVENVIKAFEHSVELNSLDDLETKKGLYSDKFKEMRESGNEHDALAVDECARRYAAAKQRIQQDEINRASFGDGFVDTVTSDRPDTIPSVTIEEMPKMFKRVGV